MRLESPKRPRQAPRKSESDRSLGRSFRAEPPCEKLQGLLLWQLLPINGCLRFANKL